MLKKIGIFAIGLVLVFSMSVSPVMAASKTSGSKVAESSADSWRYNDGYLNEDVDENQYNGQVTLKGVDTGGCTVAWSKLNGEFYNSTGSVIKGAYRKGMDISHWQKDINWEKVKTASDIDFVIIRCGYGIDTTSKDDKKWIRNVEACEKYGIPYGVYLYSYATSLDEAKSEAKHVLRLIKGHHLDYPVYYDLEDKKVKAKGKANIEKYAKTFCSMIEEAGYDAGIYANLTWWRNYLNSKDFDKYDRWVAQWSKSCTYEKNYRLWQCTSDGSVPGIKGRVDINFDFSSSGPSTSSGQPAEQVTETEVSYSSVTTENVNYRTGPATTYTKKGTYKKGTIVKVVSECSNGWGKLSNGYYMNLQYSKKQSEVSEAVTKAYKAKLTQNLNYRKGPGTNYKKVGTYKKGKVVTIKSVKNGWGKLSNGYYIYLKYTKKQ